MNKAKKLILTSIAFITIIACDTSVLENAVDNFGIVIGLDPVNTSATVIITDAKTNEIINASVQVDFKGVNSNNIIDTFSEPVENIKTSNGILNFGLKNTIVPSEQNSTEVTVKLTAPGYKELEKTLSISELGNSSYTVSMIKLSNLPEGISIQNNNNIVTTANDGKINDNVKISVTNLDTDDNLETGVNLEFTKGTIFEDQNGNSLTGDLSFNTTYYNPSDARAINALPEKLLENVNDSALVVLGAAELNITDSSGNSFKGTVKKSTTNKKTTEEYVVGFILNNNTYSSLQQLLRLAYISPATAERFIIYTVPEVTQLDGGRVELRYLLNTNLFQNMALVYFSEQPCNTSLTINRNGNQGKLGIDITDKGFSRVQDLQAPSNTITINNVTKGAKTIEIKLPYTTFSQSLDLCNTNATIDLPTPPPALINATMRVLLSCTNNDEKVRVTDLPTASIVYRTENSAPGAPWRVATNLEWVFNSDTQELESASCKVNAVELGKRYNFKVIYDNNIAEKTILIDGPTVTYNEIVDGSFCN